MKAPVNYGATQSDQFIVSTITGPQWIMGAVLLCALFFVALKRIFNTWSVFVAYRNLRENDKTRKEYMRLFETRENLLFHIGSAKAHGEFDLARKLLKELDVVDKVWTVVSWFFSLYLTMYMTGNRCDGRKVLLPPEMK
jgi:hypothetical protein